MSDRPEPVVVNPAVDSAWRLGGVKAIYAYVFACGESQVCPGCKGARRVCRPGAGGVGGGASKGPCNVCGGRGWFTVEQAREMATVITKIDEMGVKAELAWR